MVRDTPSGQTRIRLEMPRAERALNYFELMNGQDWLRYIGDREITNIAAARDYIRDHLLTHHRTHGLGMFSVILPPDQFVGVAGFVKREYLPYPDLGLALLPQFYRQGIAFEVSRMLLEMAWKRYALPEVLAIALETNERSVKLVKKLGFSPHGQITNPDGDRLDRYRKVRPSNI